MNDSHLIDRTLTKAYRSIQRVLDKSWSPPLTVWEAAHEIVMSMELAGVPRDQVDVAVSRGKVVLSGVRKCAPGREAYPPPRFRRTVALPGDADARQVVTEMQQGVLKVRVARRPPCTPLA
jgi:HSP20 family protein